MKSELHPDRARSVTAIIMSYVHTGGTEEDTRKIDKLRYLIRSQSGYDLNREYIMQKITVIRKGFDENRKMEKAMGEVFGEDPPDPRYRMGSVYCPSCKRFKNYKKECPFCHHFEMAL